MVSATALLLLLSPVTAFTPFGVITRLSPATSSSSKLYSTEAATASGYVNAGGFDSAAVDVKIVEDLLVERNLYRDEVSQKGCNFNKSPMTTDTPYTIPHHTQLY